MVRGGGKLSISVQLKDGLYVINVGDKDGSYLSDNTYIYKVVNIKKFTTKEKSPKNSIKPDTTDKDILTLHKVQQNGAIYTPTPNETYQKDENRGQMKGYSFSYHIFPKPPKK